MGLAWPDLLLAFAVCHLAGDYLLQTDRQARDKLGGLTGPRPARWALAAHVTTFSVAFLPALAWLAVGHGRAVGALGVLLIALPHAGVDDGRVVRWWLCRVKAVRGPDAVRLAPAVDQSMHAVCLWAAAVVLTL